MCKRYIGGGWGTPAKNKGEGAEGGEGSFQTIVQVLRVNGKGEGKKIR